MTKSVFSSLGPLYNKNGQLKSSKWYRDNVRQLFNNPPSHAKIMSDQERLSNKIIPGKMYLFAYDAKLKEVLPYYDMFPLVLPFKPYKDGFLGLNFHYIPYQARVAVLNKLMTYTNDKSMSEKTKIMVSWKMLNGAAHHPAIAPCVKRYLYPHVKSRFLTINANEWTTAVMLPIESFHGATKTKVWADSKKKM